MFPININAQKLVRRLNDADFQAHVSVVGNTNDGNGKLAKSVITDWLHIWNDGTISIHNRTCDPMGTPPVPHVFLDIVHTFLTEFEEGKEKGYTPWTHL